MSGGTAGPRLTRRGWIALAAVGALVTAVAIVVVIALPSRPDCTVHVGDRTVALSADEAERVTDALSVVRRGTSVPSVAAVTRTVDLSPADAAAVAAAVSGRAPAALSCRRGGASGSASRRLDGHGLTARAEAVRTDLLRRFGALPLGGFAPGGVHTGHMVGSAHYEGRAIDVFFRPVNTADRERGWALAYYLVAHAQRLAVATVIFDDRIWTARRADEGWRHYTVDTSGKSRATARILEHRDHVHVDVTA